MSTPPGQDPELPLESTQVQPSPQPTAHTEAAEWLSMALSRMRPLPPPPGHTSRVNSAGPLPAAAPFPGAIPAGPAQSAPSAVGDAAETAPRTDTASTHPSTRPSAMPVGAVPGTPEAHRVHAAPSRDRAASIRTAAPARTRAIRLVAAVGMLAVVGAAVVAGSRGWSARDSGAAQAPDSLLDGRTLTELPPPPDGFAPIAAGAHRVVAGVDQATAGAHRQANLQQPVWVMTHPVTEREWTRLMGTTVEGSPPCGPACPVVRVNFVDALAYANALSDREGLPRCYVLEGCTGRPGARDHWCEEVHLVDEGSAPPACTGYRLPLESEWAAAGRSEAVLFHRMRDRGEIWHQGNAEARRPDVAGWPASDAGLHDMISLVQEWVWDVFAFVAVDGELSPEQADVQLVRQRTLRGQPWTTPLHDLNPGFRVGAAPRLRSSTVGFRVARTVP